MDDAFGLHAGDQPDVGDPHLILALRVGLVLYAAEDDLMGARRQGNRPAGPIVFASEALDDLAIHLDEQRVHGGLQRGLEVEGQRLAFGGGHRGADRGGAFVDAGVGGYEGAPAAVLGGQHGPDGFILRVAEVEFTTHGQRGRICGVHGLWHGEGVQHGGGGVVV